MDGVLSGERVLVSRPEAAKLTLSFEEAAFLLDTGRIIIKTEKDTELTFEEFLKHALEINPNFGARYIVYKDLKERGYAVRAGEAYFLLYPRGTGSESGSGSESESESGAKSKPARYFIRISSEREILSVRDMAALLVLSHNMRKGLIIAVVDDESDITYYEVKEAKFDLDCAEERKQKREAGRTKMRTAKTKAFLLGDRVALSDKDLAVNLYKDGFYGNLTKENRLLLSLVETAYLIKNELLVVVAAMGQELEQELSSEQFIEHAATIESNFIDKYRVYDDLRVKGQIVKTGFKFGSHFRAYRALNQRHSPDLIHVLSDDHLFSMLELARAVRLAHGVRKRMIFAFREKVREGKEEGVKSHIKYISIGRMKL